MKRKFGYLIFAFVLVGGGIVGCWQLVNPTSTHRIRLGIEIDTPDGVRSGSSVIDVRFSNLNIGPPEMRHMHISVSGEAVFVDLGNGKNVIAILGFGPKGDGEGIGRLVAVASGASTKSDGTSTPAITVTLPANLIPTLITFTDINDPTTAQVVYATEMREFRDSRGWLQSEPRVAIDRFTELFGPGVRLNRASVEIVPMGFWPFSALGWPSSLAGEPITRGIENKLLWWGKPLPWIKPTGPNIGVDTRPFVPGKYRLMSEQFRRSY